MRKNCIYRPAQDFIESKLTTSNLILNKSLSFAQINFLEKYLGIFEAGSTIHGIHFVREHRI